MNQKIFRLRRIIEQPEIRDIEKTVREQMGRINLGAAKGKSVAITAGSRGIPNIEVIIKTVVAVLKENGVSPFVVPCMGSHGGATAAGQIALLEKLAMSEADLQCPVRSDMRTREIATVEKHPCARRTPAVTGASGSASGGSS